MKSTLSSGTQASSKKRPLDGKPSAFVPKAEDRLLADVRNLILDAREQTAHAVNAVLTLT